MEKPCQSIITILKALSNDYHGDNGHIQDLKALKRPALFLQDKIRHAINFSRQGVGPWSNQTIQAIKYILYYPRQYLGSPENSSFADETASQKQLEPTANIPRPQSLAIGRMNLLGARNWCKPEARNNCK